MHPYRGIVCTYRRLDILYRIPDDQNTLTHQSADTNNAPRDPLHGPITDGGILINATQISGGGSFGWFFL